MVEFLEMNDEGEISHVRTLKQEDILKCPFAIIVHEHYRIDGSCRCDDAEHRKFMISEWEYTEKDFENIPLRRDT